MAKICECSTSASLDMCSNDLIVLVAKDVSCVDVPSRDKLLPNLVLRLRNLNCKKSTVEFLKIATPETEGQYNNYYSEVH